VIINSRAERFFLDDQGMIGVAVKVKSAGCGKCSYVGWIWLVCHGRVSERGDFAAERSANGLVAEAHTEIGNFPARRSTSSTEMPASCGVQGRGKLLCVPVFGG